MPVEPPPCVWDFPDAATAGGTDEIVAIGADLEPGTLLAAYRRGLFPMYAGRSLAWWSPDPRGIIPLDGFALQPFAAPRDRAVSTCTVDTAFVDVMRGCADPSRPHGWIDSSFVNAYTRLHELGWAHSRGGRGSDGVLAGGLYGVRIGRFFAGESMFHRVTDASKVACWATVELSAPRRRDAVRRAVDDTAPALARCRRRRAQRIPAVASVGAHGAGADLPQPVVQQVAGRARRSSKNAASTRTSCAISTRRPTARRSNASSTRSPTSRSRSCVPATTSSRPRASPRPTCRRASRSIEVLLAHPEVMERPVVFVGDRAVIARPSEKVLDLLD